jgi:hypothetical protein
MEKHLEISKNRLLHLTSFKSTKIIEIANIIAARYGAKIQKGEKIDTVQLDARNKADTYVLDFWAPRTVISEGIKNILDLIDQECFDSHQYKDILER